MKIMTVLGPIEPEELGVTEAHEHVCVDIRCNCPEPLSNEERRLQNQTVDLSKIDILQNNPYAIKDNLVLNDENVAVQELTRFKRVGGSLIVEMTNTGMGRDANFLERVAQRTSLNIIMACGYYVGKCHPENIQEKTTGEIAQQMVGEIMEGVEGTGVKAGIIGEIGTSEQILPQEEKVLIAAAIAHKKTGLAISVHLCPGAGHAFEVLDILEAEGADLNKVILCHLEDDLVRDSFLDDCEIVAKRSAYVGFFAFGHLYRNPRWNIALPTDEERIKALINLIERGFLSRILLSCDTCFKMNLHKYGGGGYEHLLVNIVPRLKQLGVSQREVNTLLVDNPREVLAF